VKLAFFDFETTGKDLENDRVTQLAVALYDSESRRLVGCYSNTLYSEEYPPTHPDAARVTGLDDDYIKRVGELPRESFIILMHYFGKADMICGHNIKSFDIPVLKAEMKRMLLPVESVANLIDTRYDLEIPAHIATRKLSYLAVEHGIPVVGAHAAIFDVIMNADLLFKYNFDRTLELAKSPDLWVRADVKFEQKDKAKEKNYRWDGRDGKKIWVKLIKEMNYDDEIKNSDFPVLKLPSYVPETN
jgi:DNA polymerase-3 subunit epsilon